MLYLCSMKEITGIYLIENLKNGKCYVGKSINVYRRIKEHFTTLSKNKHFNSHFQRCYNKTGGKWFVGGLIEECAEYLLNERENYWMDYFYAIDEGYNMELVTSNGGHEWSEKLREKQSVIMKASYVNRDPKDREEDRMKKRERMLEWRKNNPMLSYRGKKVKVYSLDGAFIAEYSSAVEAALAMEMRENRVRDCIYGKRGAKTRFLKYKGFIFLREGETIEKRLERIVVETNTPNAAC